MIFPNSSEFFAGSSVHLSCTAYGIPLPTITWSRGGLGPLTATINDSRVDIWDEVVVVREHTFVRSHLRMCSTVEMDSGLYNCTAVAAERETGVVFEMTVVGVPPTLIQTPGTAYVVYE